MFGLEILGVLIGLFLVYFVLSVLASAASELISGLLGMRSKDLENGVKALFLDDEEAAAAFYAHPAITSLRKKKALIGGVPKPSYIPSDVFARIFLEIKGGAQFVGSKPALVAEIDRAISAYEGWRELEKVENWFNSSMDRVSGWYKRRVQIIVLVFALIAVTATNADTISLANTLWQDPVSREQIVALAERTVQEPQEGEEAEDEAVRSVEAARQVTSLKLLGWKAANPEIDDAREVPRGLDNWLAKIAGLLITVGAVSMGAPFWFDKINELLKFRGGLSGNTPGRNLPAR